MQMYTYIFKIMAIDIPECKYLSFLKRYASKIYIAWNT